MADPKTAMELLIEENGGRLVRRKKHKVYRFPNGLIFVHASTPSCPLADINALAALKRLLGIHPPDRGAPGTRRNKRFKQKDALGSKTLPLANHIPSQVETWQDKLRLILLEDTRD